MDKEQPQSSTNLATSLLVAVAMFAAGGFVVHQLPFQDSRPIVSASQVYEHHAEHEQDVDARLWQDPFAAVTRFERERKKQRPSEEKKQENKPSGDLEANAKSAYAPHSAEFLARSVSDRVGSNRGDDALVLGVLLRGGPYPEYAESRRRTRYAVVAGLHRADFVPEDEEHIGYVNVPVDKAPADGHERETTIPYEWFTRDPYRVPDHAGHKKVLLLWFDYDYFRLKPLARIADVLNVVLPGRTGANDLNRPNAGNCTQACSSADQFPSLVRVVIKLIGPPDSGALQKMRAELEERCPGNLPSCSPIPGDSGNVVEIFSPIATAPDNCIQSAGVDFAAC
jgi:hypothetical protein